MAGSRGATPRQTPAAPPSVGTRARTSTIRRSRGRRATPRQGRIRRRRPATVARSPRTHIGVIAAAAPWTTDRDMGTGDLAAGMMLGRTPGTPGWGGTSERWTITFPAGIEARQVPRRTARIGAPLHTLNRAANGVILRRASTIAGSVPGIAIPEVRGGGVRLIGITMTPTVDAATGRDR